MSFLGQDDGNFGIQGARATAESRVTDARRAGNRVRRLGWWPQAGTVTRFVLVALGVIVVIGWLLTLLNR